MTDQPAPLGHNNPPAAAAPITLIARLEIDYGALKVEADQLKARFDKLPPELADDRDLETATMLGKDIGSFVARVEKSHKTEKDPISRDVKTIDGFFLTGGLKGLIEPLKGHVSRRGGDYLSAKADRERIAREEEAKKLAEESQTHMENAVELTNQGRHAEAERHMNAAVATDGAAAHAGFQAAGPAKELARTYSAAGTASLRQNLDFDIDRPSVDLEALRPYLTEDALRVAIRTLVKTNGWKNDDLVVSAADAKQGVVPRRGMKGVEFKLVNASGFR